MTPTMTTRRRGLPDLEKSVEADLGFQRAYYRMVLRSCRHTHRAVLHLALPHGFGPAFCCRTLGEEETAAQT